MDCSPHPQAPQSMGFSRQEYWSGLSFPPPGDLPDPGIEPTSLMSLGLTGRFFPTSANHNLSLNGHASGGKKNPPLLYFLLAKVEMHVGNFFSSGEIGTSSPDR